MGAENPQNVSPLQWLRQEKNAVLVVLIGILVVGMIVTAYFSIKDEYVPTNRTVVVKNITYVDIVIEYERNILDWLT